MRTLRVRKFSCIAEAELEISPITLLVGPQASGKSVLCKLSYFFVGLLTDQIRAISENTTHTEFQRQVKDKFTRWFESETWGPHKFELVFSFGPCAIEISRTISRGKAGKGVKVRFDQQFINHYERSLDRIRQKADKRADSGEPSDYSYSTFMLERSIREDLRQTLKDEFVSSQIFIPAARSFFTSIGKAIAAFENSNILDPVTVLFGRMYSARDTRFTSDDPKDRAIQSLLRTAMPAMLGGNVVRERDREVLKTSDGRTIPLSTLSSGQQELFPLLRVLPRTSPGKGVRRIIYVEEPEAHLFPDAQSHLVELLASLANAYGPTVDMVITTHSPYVLTKFNNLITAGQVSRRRGRASAVSEIVPQSSWIKEGVVNAYALDRGKLNRIIDADGLIDGDYLDDVSNKIASEFTQLIDLEFGPDKESKK